MAWWVWILVGLGLLLLEILTPGGFYILFFGFGALVVGLLASVDLAGPAWAQWLLFSVASVAGLLVFRKPLLQRFRPATPDREVDSLVGETGVALGTIDSEAMGQVELRGTVWSARNVGEAPIAGGQRCRVRRVEGLTLWVRAE
jgi:membrane protein implicated in regulation of membrane protease activity